MTWTASYCGCISRCPLLNSKRLNCWNECSRQLWDHGCTWSSMIGYEHTAFLVITVWRDVAPLLVGACLLSPIWSHGNGTDLMYPLERLPTHPLRVLGVSALGRTCGGVVAWRYHGQIMLWCLLANALEKYLSRFSCPECHWMSRKLCLI